MEGRCESCIWWFKSWTFYSDAGLAYNRCARGFDVEVTEPTLGLNPVDVGACAVLVKGTCKNVTPSTEDEHHCEAIMYTGPEFGCVNWEERQD